MSKRADTCPHCGQRMLMRRGVRLPPMLADLFDMIAHAGERGVTCETLAWVFYPGKSTRDARKAVAVNVSRLNDFLESTDVRVRGERWQPYRIVLEDSESGRRVGDAV